MDAVKQTAWNCPTSAAVIGKGEQFELLFLGAGDVVRERIQNLVARGYAFHAVVGLRPDGQIAVACEEGADACLVGIAAAEFARRVFVKDTGLDELERLYRLPDPRPHKV